LILNDENKIYDVLSPEILCLALCFEHYKKNFTSKKSFYIPSVVNSQLNTSKLTMKEIMVCKHLVAEVSTNKLLQHIKETLKQLSDKLDNAFKAKQLSEDNEDDMNEDIDISAEIEQIQILRAESSHRLTLFDETINNIKVSKLLNSTVSMASEKKPRFTDTYHIGVNGDEHINDRDEHINDEYKLADSEELYSNMYSEYVRRSIGIKSVSLKSQSKVKSRRKDPRTELKVIPEEYSQNSELSGIREESEYSRDRSSVFSKSVEDDQVPEFVNFKVKESQNKNMSKLRQGLFDLSQHINSKQKNDLSKKYIFDFHFKITEI
jgi:hypothetical protein